MRRLAIVVPTYNRAPSLGRTLASLVGADGDAIARALSAKEDVPAVVVVDNNSNDATPETVASFGPAVRYIQERRQGLSFARNTGIEAARALGSEFVAFIDDDVEAAPDWAGSVLRAFETHPDADCVGGRVLPTNPQELPSWLTTDHWAPLALQDHGDEPLIFDANEPRGLIGANFAFRREVFEEIGDFSPEVQRVKDGIGSTEDHEMLQRLYDAGGSAAYVPDVVVTTRVPARRMTQGYHRRWHLGHGRFTARMQNATPANTLRSAAADAVRWLRRSAARDRARAFEAETRLWFFSGILKERYECTRRR